MFRRVAAAVPAQAGRVLATAARPSIVSPIRTAAPAVSAVGRRQYHEKDKCPILFVREVDVVAIKAPRHCTTISALYPYENAQLTSAALLDHYNKPRNVGSMSKTDTDVGTGLVGAPACGDVMKLQIRVDPLLIVHCSMLAEDAIKSAISNYYTKNPNARQTDLGGKSAPLPKVEIETVSSATA